MSNALAETEAPSALNELAESEWQALEMRVKRLSKVSFLPEAYRGKPDDIMAAGLALNAVGLPLTPRTISYVYVVKGRVDFMYQLISTLVHQHGHELWISEESNDSVTVCGQRAGSDRVHSATFTLEDAKRAGLVEKNPTYKAYTRDMLVARAGKRCANRVCPEATMSLPPAMRFVPAPSAGAQARLEAVDEQTGEILEDYITDAELVEEDDHGAPDEATRKVHERLAGLNETQRAHAWAQWQKQLLPPPPKPLSSSEMALAVAILAEAEVLAAGADAS